MKRTLCFLLSLTLICSLCAAFAQEEAPSGEPDAEAAAAEVPVCGSETSPAADGSANSGTCGEDVNWELNSETGVLTVSGRGPMAEYDTSSGNYAPWYNNRGSVKEVIIEDGVTTVGSSAFFGCINLTVVSLPDSVTAVGGGAFRSCSDLTGITLPSGVTAVGGCAFYNCASLTRAEIRGAVTDIETCVFYNCASLTDITLPGSVTTVAANAFAYCRELKNVYYGGSDSLSVSVGEGNTCLTGAAWHYAFYTVRYDANGGTGAPEAQSAAAGEAMTLSTVIPVRVGYTFLGWSADSTAGAADHAAGSACTPAGSVTLYAVWKYSAASLTSGRTCKTSIDTAGGSVYYTCTPESSRTYVLYSAGSPDAIVTLYDRSGNILRSCSSENGRFRLACAMTAGETYLFGICFSDKTETGSISFKFGRVYTIRYNANGGTGAPTAQERDYGSVTVLTDTVPTRPGYSFRGWAASKTAAAASYMPGDVYTANGNVTLYALWAYDAQPLRSARSYTANIKNAGDSVYYSFTADSAKTYVLYTAGSEDARIDLYNADGKPVASESGVGARLACTLAAGETCLYRVSLSDSSAAGSIVLKFGRVYTVKYNANGGTGTPKTQTRDYGTTLMLTADTPTRAGYTFLGWSTAKTASRAAYRPGDPYTANGNVTLYAIWQKNG